MKIFKKSVLALLLAMGFAGTSHSADYGLPSEIQKGNILHCFNWTMAQVKEELPNIAAAGFGSVQLSPMQRSDARVGWTWHDLYRPYDLAFLSSSNGLGSETDLKNLCTEASKYGIKIIVDVVANHVDEGNYHDSWWNSNGRLRYNGSINYGDRYSITHGQLGSYPDVNSESQEVISRCKAYVEKLKSLGVKGIRWDAAKHIGLPSEGCNFWSTIASVSGMYHYGEILDSPGPNSSLAKEYANYMSITDNRYSNSAARDNGGIPQGFGGEWASNQNINGSKLVYWGESHDTYSNDEWSQNVDQSVIDRAYCAFACREGATALYFSRPETKGNNNIKIGRKGSLSFKGNHITQVNKFRNAMIGKADYCTNNGNAFCVTRQGGGAVIVMKGSGNVQIQNGGGYCPPGTYTDKVSGGTFTVTSSTITGSVGSSGVAVIYNNTGGGNTGGDQGDNQGETPDPDPNPDNKDDFSNLDQINGIYLNNTKNWDNPTVWIWNDSENFSGGNWPGQKMTKVGDYWKWEKPSAGGTPAQIIFSNNGSEQTASLVYVNNGVYDCDGNMLGQASGGSGSHGGGESGGGTADDGTFTIYYDDSESCFGQVNIYYWPTQGFSWPGLSMISMDNNIWKYTFTGDTSNIQGFLFCKNDGSSQTGDMNGVPQKGHLYKGKSGKGQVTDQGVYNGGGSQGGGNSQGGDNPGGGQGSSQTNPEGSLITDYYKVNPNGQFGSNRTVTMNFNNQNSTSALSNWTGKDLIAQGVARDVCQAIKGVHERPVVDSYAIYAAYDNSNLYLGVQFVYTVWDIGGEGKQPGESKPYNMDGRMMWAFDLNPDKQFDGYIGGNTAIWNDDGQPGAKFNNGVDAVWMGSTKPGVGTPGFFIPTPEGHASYDSQYCLGSTVRYGYADGLLPSISNIWGQGQFGYNPSVLTGNSGFKDLKGEIAESAHTFYEFTFPLSLLGISADYIKNNGIGVMYLDVYGSSPVGGTPYDPSYFDNAAKAYSMDPSSSMEKEDEDIITYACARIGKASSGVEEISVPNGKFSVYGGNGSLSIFGVESNRVLVSDIFGKSLYCGPCNGNLTLDLNSGIYIVNVNGLSKKVLVK